MILTNHTHNINLEISLGHAQSHGNMAIIPIKTIKTPKFDFLTLKKGFELDLIEVKECEQSTVNTIKIINNAVTPLIIFNGEEIIGAKQNRIINNTMILEPKSENHISVSCTEQGRWHHTTPNFKQSVHMMDFDARLNKEVASRTTDNYQDVVWESIRNLEIKNNFISQTHAMSESYENLKTKHDEFLNEFHFEDDQIGVVIILDGEIKGFEMFYTPSTYQEYHEKIIKSYLIDNENKNPVFTVNIGEAEEIIAKAMDSSFNQKESEGLENVLEFENDYGIGTLYTFKNEIVHWSFFKKQENFTNEEKTIDEAEDIII